MTEDPSNVDDAQLERWAYGRAATPADQERASLAAAELQRRAAIERERAERDAAERAAAEAHARAVANGEVDDAASEHPESPPTDSERRHRRRMLATGIAGVTAAALAFVGGIVVLSQPNPDPLALFDREETQLDRDWTLRIESSGLFTAQFVEGPRATVLSDEYVAVAARVSTVRGGGSTPWDLYCLYVGTKQPDFAAWSVSGTCTYPEKFDRDGIVFPQQPSASGEGHDTVFWGPVGGIRLETDVPLQRAIGETVPSVLDGLAYGSVVDSTFDPARVDVGDRQVLMGPAFLGLSAGDGADLATFFDAEIIASTYLTRGELAEPGTRLCVHVAAGDGAEALRCDLLTTVRRDGIEVPFTTATDTWLVRIDNDGWVRNDTIERLGAVE